MRDKIEQSIRLELLLFHRRLGGQNLFFDNSHSGRLPFSTFSADIRPLPTYNDIVLLTPIRVRRFVGCPVGVGDWFATRPLPFTLVCKVGQSNPIRTMSKGFRELPLLRCVVNRNQMCVFGDRLDIRIVPTLATDAFVSVTICRIHHPYLHTRQRHE